MKRVVLAVLVVSAVAIGVASAEPGKVDRLDRVVGLARIWAEVKYFHPAMFQRTIDWDGALIQALPEAEAASDAASYRAAIAHLLAAIGDPRTAVAGAASDEAPAADWKTWAGPGVLVLNARLPGNPADIGATRRRARELRAELATARVVVIDLRGRDDDDDRLLGYIVDSLPATPIWPTVRSISHDGFRSQGETNRDTYTTSWVITSAGAATPGATPGPAHVVFAVDPAHVLPVEAVALWASGHATLVSPGALDDSAAAELRRVTLPYGVVANVRIADISLPGGRGLTADVVVSHGEDLRARAIAIASAIAAGGAAPRAPVRHTSLSSDLMLADDAAGVIELPSRARRVLAAIKAWAVIEYFHGPRRLDHDWDQQLRNAVPRLEAVTDLAGYIAALAEMLVPLGDGHTAVYTPNDDDQRKSSVIYWRRIEGKIVAGGVRDEAVAQKAGIARGDELIVAARVRAIELTTRVLQRTLPAGPSLYRGKVVVLIDDRAISSAEHTCLLLEATSGATFIGSPTAGTDGEETYVKLPGGLEMRFTGAEVFHADGRQLQQVGIQPAITVRPTLRGLRAGKDEVLDRALRYVQTGR